MLQRLSTVTLHFLAFLPEFFSSFQHHDIQQVACHWRGVQMQSLLSLPTFLTSSTQFVLPQITQFWFMTMAKTKRTPHQPLVSTNPRGLAARVAATHPSPHCFQRQGHVVLQVIWLRTKGVSVVGHSSPLLRPLKLPSQLMILEMTTMMMTRMTCGA